MRVCGVCNLHHVLAAFVILCGEYVARDPVIAPVSVLVEVDGFAGKSLALEDGRCGSVGGVSVVAAGGKPAVDTVGQPPWPPGHKQDHEAHNEVRYGEAHQDARDTPRLPLVAVVLEQPQN